MKRLIDFLIGAVLIFTLAATVPSSAQEKRNDLKRLDPLLGGEWVCTSWDGEKPKHKQFLRWEAILDGNAIRETMKKPEIDFSREGLIYRDAEKEQVVSLIITNNGLIGRTTVSWENGKSAWIIKMTDAEGRSMEQKETLELLSEDRLRAISYIPSADGWVQRHVLEYAR